MGALGFRWLWGFPAFWLFVFLGFRILRFLVGKNLSPNLGDCEILHWVWSWCFRVRGTYRCFKGSFKG